jgi:hypothetical protein
MISAIRLLAAGIGTSSEASLQSLAQALAPLLMKVIPKEGETFLGWKDAAGKILTRDTTCRTTMPTGPVQFSASFKGGTVGLIGMEHGKEGASMGPAAPDQDRDALGKFSTEKIETFPFTASKQAQR